MKTEGFSAARDIFPYSEAKTGYSVIEAQAPNETRRVPDTLVSKVKLIVMICMHQNTTCVRYNSVFHRSVRRH